MDTRRIATLEVIVLGGYAAFLGSMAAWAAIARRTSLETRFTRTRPSPICGLAEGRCCKVVGRVRPLGDTLTAPLTGRACVLYDVSVESKTEEAAFFKPQHESASVPFWVEEGKDRVLIDPTFVKTWLHFAHTGETGLLRPPSDALVQFMSRHGRSLEGQWGKRTFAFREASIAEGDLVAVIGFPGREADPGATADLIGYRISPTRLHMLSEKRRPVLVSNAPRATKR